MNFSLNVDDDVDDVVEDATKQDKTKIHASINVDVVVEQPPIHDEIKMEQKQKNNYVCDRLPPLSAKYPWFVAQNLEDEDENNVGDKLFYTIQKPLLKYRCRVPELCGKRIRACFHGWVILSNYPNNVMWSLWNPNTSKLIRLPPLKTKLGDHHECCLSLPPDDPRSIFLLTTIGKPTFVFCRLDCKRKKLRWTEMSYDKQFRRLVSGEDGFLDSLTCCNGKVYALGYADDHSPHILEINIVVKDKEVVINILQIVRTPHACFPRCPRWRIDPRFYYFLKGSGTDLFCIELAYEDETSKTVGNIHLFKLNMTSIMWEELEDLKYTTFFIKLSTHHVSSISRQEIASEFGGYIHILYEKGKVIYSYNIKYRTIFVSSLPFLVQKSQVSDLVMLECRLDGDHPDSSQQEEEQDHFMSVRSISNDDPQTDCPVYESHLLDIPFHILEMIMKLCVGVEYMNFRATCKRCNLAAPPLQWSNETLLRRLQTYSLVSPWLMVLDKHQGVITFTDPLLGDNYFIKTPQELIGSQIYYSRYGWLLMYKTDGALVFFNPFTNDIRQLPHVHHLDTFCFSVAPTSPDCVVVGFNSLEELDIYLHIVARESFWRLNALPDPYTYLFPTFCNGDLFAVCDNNFSEESSNAKELHVYKRIGQEDCFWEAFPNEDPRSCSTTPAKHFLAKCDQHCFLVIVYEFGRSIEVFNLNDSRIEWEKVDGLGKHMIYLSGSTCLCIEAKSPHMENKIYFPRLHAGKIVFFSFETCRYHTFNGKKWLKKVLWISPKLNIIPTLMFGLNQVGPSQLPTYCV